MEDIFVPNSRTEDALVSQLHTVTFHTGDKAACERLFLEGYRLDWTGWHRPADADALGAWLGLDAGPWEVACFGKHGAGANVRVRVIHTPGFAPQVRPEYDGLLVGGATISFPLGDFAAHEERMKALGFASTVGVKELEFASPDGQVYTSAEIIYFGPENTYFLGVKRPEIFVPVGPTDPVTGIGGAAYSALCVDGSDRTMAFLADVLGWELRRDMHFDIGDSSALLLPEGARERFVQAFAPGASTGYIVLMDHYDDNRHGPIAPRLPARGIVMYAMATRDIGEVHRRAMAAGATILQPPQAIASPFLDSREAMIVAEPGGFAFEIFTAAE